MHLRRVERNHNIDIFLSLKQTCSILAIKIVYNDQILRVNTERKSRKLIFNGKSLKVEMTLL